MSNRDKDAAMRFPAHCDLSPARVGMRVITKASRWDEKLQLILQEHTWAWNRREREIQRRS